MGQIIIHGSNSYGEVVSRHVPVSVGIAGLQVEVVVDSNLATHGGWDFETMSITLAEGQGETAWRTLWHEMGHGSLALSGISEVLASYDQGLEEILMTMWDNIGLPAIVRTIFDSI